MVRSCLVYLGCTDDIRHQFGDSPKMEEAVIIADLQAKEIWDAIKIQLVNMQMQM